MNDRDTIGLTYVLYCYNSKEYYCGYTKDLTKRLDQHRKGVSGSWFKMNKRTEFVLELKFKGNFEKEIKRFGVKRFYELFNYNQIEVSLS